MNIYVTPMRYSPLGGPNSPAFTDEFARLAGERTVCTVCGLARMGHAPESQWLGYAAHPYGPRDASGADMRTAQGLTSRAYRARRMAREVTT